MKGFKVEEFEKERDLRREKFDQKFESIFGLNQKRFEKDETLRDFKDHGL
jgi:hypothetical protein